MKSVSVMLLAACVSVSAFAQSNAGVSSTKIDQGIVSKTKGVEAALVYSNLTDSMVKSTTTYKGVTKDETWHSGGSVGLMGLSVGYKDKYAFGSFGYVATGSVMKSINSSEMSSKVTIYKTQGNLILPMGDMFSLVGGVNVSYWDQIASESSANVTVDPGVGLDLGLKIEKAGMGIFLGSQLLSFTGRYSEPGLDGKSEGYVNGFITQISYTF